MLVSVSSRRIRTAKSSATLKRSFVANKGNAATEPTATTKMNAAAELETPSLCTWLLISDSPSTFEQQLSCQVRPVSCLHENFLSLLDDWGHALPICAIR